jgi:hypothetical protein
VTTRTRRLLFFSVLFAILALPAETLLLRAVQTPNQDAAIQAWADNLKPADADAIGDQIQLYPFQYRKAIMRAATPERRSEIWRAHMKAYVQVHRELDAAAVDAINAAAALASAENLSEPTTESRAAIHAIADQIVNVLGRDQADYLLFYLGPKDGTFASFEPLAMRLTNKVRDLFTLQAFANICDCALSWGCMEWRQSCVTWSGCSQTQGWPQCGWLWNDPCDGGCVL